MANTFQIEPKLTIQSFHQCSSLISIKFSMNNFLLWRSQVLSLIRSLGLEHHIHDEATPPKMINIDGKEASNPEFLSWKNNDGLLMTWLRGMMCEDVLSLIVGGETSREVWLSIEEQILPATKVQESWLKDNLYSIKKGNTAHWWISKEFKNLGDNLAAIGKPIPDDDKVFQIARALGPKYADFKTTMFAKTAHL